MSKLLRYFSDRVLEVANTLEDEVSRPKGLCPITDGLIVTGFLSLSSGVKIPHSSKSLPRLSPEDLITYLHSKYGPEVSFMVWNLSGEKYDYSALEDQVSEHYLGIHPSPPMDTLVQLVEEISQWMSESEKHVAILHDLSGRRSAVVAACVLLKQQQEELHDRRRKVNQTTLAAKVLDVIGNTMGAPGRALIPSQVRYVEYYTEVERVDVKKTLQLQRVIVNGIPDFVNAGGEPPDKMKPVKCKPFVKVFKGKKVVAGSEPRATYTPGDTSFSITPFSPFPRKDCPEHQVFDDPLDTGSLLEGDVLLRCYHFDDETSTAYPMFAVAFHVAFVKNGVLRLTANEIDGAKGNGRFPRHFFIDLIFSGDTMPEDEREEEQDKPQPRPGLVRTNTTRTYQPFLRKNTSLESTASSQSSHTSPEDHAHEIVFSKEEEDEDEDGPKNAVNDETAARNQEDVDRILLETLELETNSTTTAAAATSEQEEAMSESKGGAKSEGDNDEEDDLEAELKRFEQELELDTTKSSSGSLSDGFDKIDEEDFDIDAFASSLHLDD